MKQLKKIQLKTNTIYRGDNLAIMKAMPDNCVDLVYIDPPFFTQKDYKNICGDKESVLDWENNRFDGFYDTKDFFERHVHNGEKGLTAYLSWMRLRLVELKRILKPNGSFYLHLDYHAVHYMKVICDEIFGYDNFINEIIWQRKRGTNHAGVAKSFSSNTDTILLYVKGKNYTFNPQFQEYTEDYIKSAYNKIDENGERYRGENMRAPSYSPTLVYKYKGYEPHPNGWCVSLEKMEELDSQGLLIFPKNKSGRITRKNYLKDRKGLPITNLWTDIDCVQGHSKEKTGWPTQKPVTLLERIIQTSSHENDLIFDCFAGCGTTMHAAHNLKRKWIGIDISPTAIKVNQKRLGEIGAKVNVVDEDDLATFNQYNKAG